MFQCITKTLFLSDGVQQLTNLARRLDETGYSLSKES